MEAKKNHKCERCGYQWTSFKLNPKACPACKSYRWKIEKTVEQEQKENN